jgi:hypothetical protein
VSRVIASAPRGRAQRFTLGYCLRSIFGHCWVSLEFEPRDIWIGMFVKDLDMRPVWRHATDIYICVVPLLPIVIRFRHQGRIGVKLNFRYWRREARYRLECRIFGEDATWQRWYA